MYAEKRLHVFEKVYKKYMKLMIVINCLNDYQDWKTRKWIKEKLTWKHYKNGWRNWTKLLFQNSKTYILIWKRQYKIIEKMADFEKYFENINSFDTMASVLSIFKWDIWIVNIMWEQKKNNIKFVQMKLKRYENQNQRNLCESNPWIKLIRR